MEHISRRDQTKTSTHSQVLEKTAPKWVAAVGALAFGLLY
jgi:hypothetical protein